MCKCNANDINDMSFYLGVNVILKEIYDVCVCTTLHCLFWIILKF